MHVLRPGAALLARAGGAAPQFSDIVIRVEVESDDIDSSELSSVVAARPCALGLFLLSGQSQAWSSLLPQIRHRPSLRHLSRSAGNRCPSEPRTDAMPLGTFPLADWPLGLDVGDDFESDFFFDEDWVVFTEGSSRFLSVSRFQ